MESMKPNEKQKQQTSEPARTTASRMADGEAIPVYELTFRQQFPDLGFDGGGGSSGRFRASKLKNRSILYFPKLHVYRCEETYVDKEPRVIFVPREWASFEPLTDQHKI